MNKLTNKIAKGFFAFAALGAVLTSTGASAGQVIYQPIYPPIYSPFYQSWGPYYPGHWPECSVVNFGSHIRQICY